MEGGRKRGREGEKEEGGREGENFYVGYEPQKIKHTRDGRGGRCGEGSRRLCESDDDGHLSTEIFNGYFLSCQASGLMGGRGVGELKSAYWPRSSYHFKKEGRRPE